MLESEISPQESGAEVGGFAVPGLGFDAVQADPFGAGAGFVLVASRIEETVGAEKTGGLVRGLPPFVFFE